MLLVPGGHWSSVDSRGGAVCMDYHGLGSDD